MIYEVLIPFSDDTIPVDINITKDKVSSFICFTSEPSLSFDNFDLGVTLHSLDENFYNIIKHSDVIFLDDLDVLMTTRNEEFEYFLKYTSTFLQNKEIYILTKNMTGKNFIRSRKLYKVCDKRFKISKKNGRLERI